MTEELKKRLEAEGWTAEQIQYIETWANIHVGQPATVTGEVKSERVVIRPTIINGKIHALSITPEIGAIAVNHLWDIM